MKRTIYIGADSAGYLLKEELKAHLAELGYETVDMGTDSTASCHYPEFAEKVCTAVAEKSDERFGILVCGTGIGMSMCANKHRGIRAALCSDTYSARLTRNHNDANVLCIGDRVLGTGLALELVDAFVDTEFEGGKHLTRIEMFKEFENA